MSLDAARGFAYQGDIPKPAADPRPAATARRARPTAGRAQ